MPTVNSFIMQQNMPYAQLSRLPQDSNHGARTTSTREPFFVKHCDSVFEWLSPGTKRINEKFNGYPGCFDYRRTDRHRTGDGPRFCPGESSGCCFRSPRRRRFKELVSEIRKAGCGSRVYYKIRADVRCEDDVRNLIDKTVERFGHLDVAVNTAGILEERAGPLSTEQTAG